MSDDVLGRMMRVRDSWCTCKKAKILARFSVTSAHHHGKNDALPSAGHRSLIKIAFAWTKRWWLLTVTTLRHPHDFPPFICFGKIQIQTVLPSKGTCRTLFNTCPRSLTRCFSQNRKFGTSSRNWWWYRNDSLPNLLLVKKAAGIYIDRSASS
jgi:hypothetical protein